MVLAMLAPSLHRGRRCPSSGPARLLCVVALLAPLTACGAAPAPPGASPLGTTEVRSERVDAEAKVSEAASSAAPEAREASPPARPPAPALPRGTAVLHVGDSFVHSGLTQRLREHLAPLGVRYEVRAQHSTNSLDWAKRVPELVASTQPDLVIVTLGGNEIASKHLPVQARAIRRIVEAIGQRSCVWTTPPLWRDEDGLFDVLQENLSPCRFFETDVEVGSYLPRRDDGIHPTAEGGARWADALWAYLERERTGEPKPWSLAEAPSSERTPRGRRSALPH
jgi:hypothetical protein